MATLQLDDSGTTHLWGGVDAKESKNVRIFRSPGAQRTTLKWLGYGLSFVIGLVVVFVLFAVVATIISRWPKTLYTISERGYEFEVIYHPGGGAIGGSHELEVRVTGGTWNNDELIRVEAADSAEVTFLGGDAVRIRVLRKYSALKPHEYYWNCIDSVNIDLSKPNR